MTAGLKLAGVEKVFAPRGRPPTTALSELNLEIESNEFVAVVGPSGCGKTTLLRVLAGLTLPSKGAVTLDGEQITEPRPDLVMMFQSPTLLPWRKVIDNCLLPIEIRRKVTPEDADRARDLLERAGLGGFEDRYPNELSGGMQQRVALCRALIAQPSVLLLDEPFGALDAMTRDQMNLDLHRMWHANELTTVLITHSITEAVLLAQRIVVMSPRPGRVVDVYRVPLPASRDLDVLNSPRFAEACAYVRQYFTKDGSENDPENGTEDG
ncbi:ABC transporter ATP-binding protein [Pseudonocardia acaciae]|uniref:ABC transporter ATP-binding protein n=1 Tax=Pseudonocardia acaciae TaxID=551276 RepID=UPI000684FD7E|nr:ABC transporter ATP-binding protein [Pseudonocardia acaciae]